MQFQDDLAAGVTLVRPALQSPDYDPGVAGWAIKIDGSAEFNDVTIRGGTVVSGTALYYDGAPAAGSLFLSIAAAAGVDAYGNAFDDGLTVGKPGTRQVRLTYDTEGGYIELPMNDPSELTTGSVAMRRSNTGNPLQRIFMQIATATQTVAGGTVAIRLQSATLDGTGPSRFEVVADPLGVVDQVFTSSHQQTQVLPDTPSALSALYVQGPAGHTGNLLRLVDNATNRLVVTAAGAATLTGTLAVTGDTAVGDRLTAPNNRGTVAAALAAAVQVDVPVVFTTPFASAPSVVCTLRGIPAGSSALITRLVSTSTTGFTVRVSDATGVARTLNINVDWVALGA